MLYKTNKCKPVEAASFQDAAYIFAQRENKLCFSNKGEIYKIEFIRWIKQNKIAYYEVHLGRKDKEKSQWNCTWFEIERMDR